MLQALRLAASFTCAFLISYWTIRIVQNIVFIWRGKRRLARLRRNPMTCLICGGAHETPAQFSVTIPTEQQIFDHYAPMARNAGAAVVDPLGVLWFRVERTWTCWGLATTRKMQFLLRERVPIKVMVHAPGSLRELEALQRFLREEQLPETIYSGPDCLTVG